ncbi:hypothetical protein AAEU32_08590 [Pseudoalteromonas sp. SSDWG2]|uniref:hypothetical protein n=1 Tax=Pseudoalteromonas sp. SSDWG2 TaxID=3139391 RepID=UPI003BADB513
MQAYHYQHATQTNEEQPRYDNTLSALFAHRQQRNQLKQQLATQPKKLLDSNELRALSARVCKQILKTPEHSKEDLAPQLATLFEAYSHVYQQAGIAKAERSLQFINEHGLVMAPDYCIHTIKDTLRVSGFIRAIDSAIAALLNSDQSKVFIAYPACGPFAPLLLPLLSYYREQGLSEETLQVTLIDIQPGAIKSLRALVTELGLQPYIQQMYCGDACAYNSPMLFDLVIIEAMQHGFSREGHLAIATHFAKQLSINGYLIPQNIDVHAMLSVAQQEYVEQWQNESTEADTINQKHADIANSRTELGVVFSINAHTLRNLEQQLCDDSTMVKAAALTVPYFTQHAQKQTLSLYTEISLFADQSLRLYDSGITHPLPDLSVCINFTPQSPQQGDTLVNSGDKLRFYYSLNGLPGFLVIKDYSGE